MNNIVNISDFRNNISDYINRIVYKNESFLIKKGKSIVAKIDSYKKSDSASWDEKIKKFAGILTDNEAKEIKKHMRKFRTNFKILP